MLQAKCTRCGEPSDDQYKAYDINEQLQPFCSESCVYKFWCDELWYTERAHIKDNQLYTVGV
jgi:endogenous inhibitor of DNA gyrase (YacG/DUF329 family)